MGKPMARNLLKAGHSLIVYDIMPAGVADGVPRVRDPATVRWAGIRWVI